MYGQEPGKKPPATPLPNDDRQVGLDEWDDIVADRFKVPKSLMKAVRSQESGGNVNAVSPTGVRGRYQVTESTAKQYGLDRNDPFQQSVAAAKHLRAMYDSTQGNDDDERWLGSVAKYYAGDKAVQGDRISGSSVDGLSNPARHVESVAKKWGEIRKAERGQQPQQQQQPVPPTIAVGHSQQFKPLAQRRTPSTTTPNVFSRNSARQQQQATQEAQQALDFRNVNPLPEAQRLTGRVMSNPGAEQRRKIADQYNQKDWLGQRGEDVRQGWESFKTGAADAVLGAADIVGSAAAGDLRPLKETARGIGYAITEPSPFLPEAQRAKAIAERERGMQQLAQERNVRQAGNPNFRRIQRERQEQQLAREAAPSMTSRVTRGVSDAVLGLPAMVGAAELGGIPAVTALTAAQQDFARDPQGAALNTAGAGLPILAGRAVSPIAARAAGRVAPALQRPVQLGVEGAAGGTANVAQYAGTQGALGREINPEEALSQGITGAVLSGAMAPKLADVQARNAASDAARLRQRIDQRQAVNADAMRARENAPTAPAPEPPAASVAPDAPPTTPVPQTPAAVPGAPRREDFPPGWEGNMKFRAAQIDFQRSGAAKAAKAPKPQMAANDLRAQVDALKIEAQEAEGAGNPASAAAKYEAAQNQLGQLRAQAKAAGDAQLYSAISEEMAINKANWQAAGRAARSGKPAPVKGAVSPAEPLPPQEQQPAIENAPTRDLTAPLPAGEAKTPQSVQEITRTTAEIPKIEKQRPFISEMKGRENQDVPNVNISQEVPAPTRDLSAPLPPFPKLTPPTNRITEGAGNELPRRVSQPLEGQPVEVPERAQPVYSPEEAAVREREALPPVERRRALREAALKGQFGKLSEASRAGATENRSLVGNAQLRRLLGLPEMPAYRLPDAEINPKTGEPHVNPEWNEAAQDTLNALAAVAGKERSSQINFGAGDAGSRGEMGDLFLAVRKLAQQKGDALEPALREAFKETVGRARTAQSGYQEFQVDERVGNIKKSLYELTRRGELTRDEIRAHQTAWREVAAEFGISRNQADELFKGMRTETRTRAERAGAREPAGADRSASRGGTGRVVEPVEQRATGTEGGGQRAAVPVERQVNTARQLKNIAALEWTGEITKAEANRRRAALEKPAPDFVAEQQRILDEYKSGKRSGSGGEQLFAQAVVTGHKLYRAGMDFAQWSAEVIKEAGDAVKPHLRRAWRELSRLKTGERQLEANKLLTEETDATLGKTYERLKSVEQDIADWEEEIGTGNYPRHYIAAKLKKLRRERARLSRVADRLDDRLFDLRNRTEDVADKVEEWRAEMPKSSRFSFGELPNEPKGEILGGGLGGLQKLLDRRNVYDVPVSVFDLKTGETRNQTIKVSASSRPNAKIEAVRQVQKSYPSSKYVVNAYAPERLGTAAQWREGSGLNERQAVRQQDQQIAAIGEELRAATDLDSLSRLLKTAASAAFGKAEPREVTSALRTASTKLAQGDAAAAVDALARTGKSLQDYLPPYALKIVDKARKIRDAQSFGELPNESKGPVATMFGGQKILDNLRAGRRKLPPKEIPKDFKAGDWITAQMENMAKRTLSNADKAKLADPKLPEADRLRILANAKITPEQEAGFERAADDAFNALQANDFDGFQDAAQRMKFITDAPATNWQKASAIRKAAMLSRPVSHLRNLLGNTAFQNLEEVSRMPGSVGDILLGTVTGRRTLEGASAEKSARAIYAAATDGVQAAKDAMAGRNNEDFMKALQVKEVHFNTPFVDKAVKKVFRLLGAEDQIFYTGAYDRAIREEAKLTARNEAKQGIIDRKDIETREKALLAAPTAQMEIDAALAANIAVFRNDNALSDAIGKMRDNLSDRANFALDLVMPFDRTPTNVILRALEYSPLGLARGAAKGVAGSARAIGAKRAAKKTGTPSKADVQAAIDEAFTPQQQRSAAQLVGRGTVGTGLLALGYVLASKGLMTGFYDEDDWRGEALKRASGAQPLAIQIGGRWWGLAGIGPIGMALGMGATMHDESKKKNGDIYGGAAKAAKEQIMEMPLLSSMKDLGRDVSRISQDRANTGKAVGNLAASFIPGIINDVGQVIPGVRDPFEREVKDDPKKVKGLRRALREGGGQVVARIPGVRRMLPVKKDITGKPVESRPLAPIDPFNSRRAVRPLPKR